MAVQTSIFTVSFEGKVEKFLHEIACATEATIQNDDVQTTRLVYLDTFDWALASQGVRLWATENRQEGLPAYSLTWIADEPIIRRPAVLPIDKIPAWPAELPDGVMRRRLEKILTLRALLPIISLDVKHYDLSVLDAEDKTRVRLSLEQYWVKPGVRRKCVDLGWRLKVEGLAGYEKNYQNVLSYLSALDNVTAVPDNILERALDQQGRKIGDYSSKVATHLERNWRTDKACRTVLLDQLDQIERNIEGTIANWDSEFLHDLRVAVRRSRSLLSRMKTAFPPSVLERFSKELAWIGSVTTPVRDLDVYMLDYPKLRGKLRDELQGDLDPFYQYLCDHHEAAQKTLQTHLKSARFKGFLEKWRAYLEGSLPSRTNADLALLPVGETADARIWKTYRRLIKEGAVIDDSSPAEALHDLRKTGKKLRYLLEFFASLYPRGQIKGLIKALKVLQENLGDFQDLDVQAEKLAQFSQDMMQEGEHRVETYMAMGVLVEQFLARKKDVRAEFAQRFAAFSSAEVEGHFRLLCNQPKPVKKSKKKAERKS